METNSLAHLNDTQPDLAKEAARVYYKHLKEDVVSGFSGGAKLEVFLLVAYLPVSAKLTHAIALDIRAPGDNSFLETAAAVVRQGEGWEKSFGCLCQLQP
jgi:hypothetical protein